jgi:hypothetical protein
MLSKAVSVAHSKTAGRPLLSIHSFSPTHPLPVARGLASSLLHHRSFYSPSMSSSSSSSSSTSSPSPSDPFAVIPRLLSLPSILPSSRVLFIGDVHGCFDELQELVELSGVRVGVDPILLTGDLIAKGPKPFEVLRWVRSTPQVWTVRGNHDQRVVEAIRKREGKPLQSIVPPYDLHPHDHVAASLSPEERTWLSSLPLVIALPNLPPPHLLVHAGLVPGLPLEEQSPFLLMNLRNVTEEGVGLKGKKEGVNWVERWKGPEKVVFGHAAARGLQQVEGGWALGLDSGCCYGKQLSGWLLPEGRLLQVQARRVYQAPDDG